MKAIKWDFRNLPSGEPMISNVVCENSLIIIYFQFIWRWSRDSVLGGRSSLPQTRKVKNIMFETSGNIFAYRLQYLTCGNETVPLKFFTTMLMLVFFTFFNWHNWKTLHSTDRLHLWERMTRLNPSALTVWPEKLRGWKKKHSSYFGPHKDYQICWNLLSSC